MMVATGLLWLCIPLLAAATAKALKWPTAPMMAALTGITVMLISVWRMTFEFNFGQSIDTSLHDTYYLMSRQHYELSVGTILAFMALPLGLIARYLPRPVWLGAVLFLLLYVGTGLTLLSPQIGATAMPRRYADTDATFVIFNYLTTAGAVITPFAISCIGVAFLVALYRMGRAHISG